MTEFILIWKDYVISAALMYARIMPIFLFLPFLGSGVMSHVVTRNAIIFLIIVGLWPAIGSTQPNLELVDFVATAFKEAVVGLAMGCMLAVPFWVLHAVGAYIDVARGATVSSAIDPMNGLESAETSNLLNLFAGVVYLQAGGLTLLLASITDSYRQFGLYEWISIHIGEVLILLGGLVAQGFMLAAPILLTLLLSEILLGVLSRYTQQLNAFSVSLTVKSMIAFLILIMYFGSVIPDRMMSIVHQQSNKYLVQKVP